MYERDYLMRLIIELAGDIRRAIARGAKGNDPSGAAGTLEAAIGAATDIDGDVLLGLAPDSMASILALSGTDPRVMEYIARSLMMTSSYHAEAGDAALAQLRHEQAMALGAACGIELAEEDASADAMEAFLAAQELEGFEGAMG